MFKDKAGFTTTLVTCKKIQKGKQMQNAVSLLSSLHLGRHFASFSLLGPGRASGHHFPELRLCLSIPGLVAQARQDVGQLAPRLRVGKRQGG